jgi:signal transduction histidine kinase
MEDSTAIHRIFQHMRLTILAFLIISLPVRSQVLNFSDHNFDDGKILPLKGTWEFYWDKLLTPQDLDSHTPTLVQVPHFWMENDQFDFFGKGTYHVKVKLPDKVNGQLAVYIPFIRCAAKVFVNGSLVDSLGRVGDPDHYQSKLASLLLAVPEGQELDLVIQIANYEFRWGGLITFRIGKMSAITGSLQIKNGFDIFFVGSILVMALYLITMYFLYREGYSFLYLALICMAVVLRSLTTEGSSLFLPSLFPDGSWTLWKKIEFFSVYSVVALFPLYVSNVFPQESSKKLDWIFIGLTSILCGVVLFTPHTTYVLLLDVCHVGLLIGFAYACTVSVKAWRKHNQDAKTLFIGILVAFPFILMEMLKNSALQIPIPFTHLVEFGVLSFLLFQVYVLANHYAMTYQELEMLVKVKTSELTESNEIKNRMLAILSHDVRGPVNMLKATMSLFNKGRLTEQELKPMAQKIEMQAGNVSLLIENILLLVKSQLQGITLNMEVFSLGDWVNSHIPLYTASASEKQIEIKTTVPDDFKVKADKNIVSLVVRNLISNAIKYSYKNSSITISAVIANESIRLSVSDTGKGMPEHQVQSILRPKSSIWSIAGTEKETGTGMGLQLCREYLLKMNTDFEIVSVPDKGTTITIPLQGS